MHIFFKLIILFLFVMPSFIAANESDQITVRLATENQLIPIYLSKMQDEGAGLDVNYLRKLEEVLQFDLNHNGMTFLIPQSNSNEKLASSLFLNGTNKPREWSPVAVFYAIKVVVKSDKKLAASLYAINEDSLKGLEGLSLSGDINKDRRQIHLLADAIYKSLFGKEGIAATRILFSTKMRGETEEKWAADIWEADYDGYNTRTLISDGSYNICPVYIQPKPGFSTGSFFFVSYKQGQPKIFLSSLKDPKNTQRLTLLRGNQLMPAISKQRDQVAFICDITGNPDLFLQDFSLEEGAKGKPRQIFAAKKATQGSPTFSPDGKRLAFVTNKDGSPRIHVMDIPALGTPLKDIKAQLLTKHSQESTAPTWSPDGSKLAYCAKINGVRQIWVYDFITREERQLTQGSGNKENPSWSPNSLCLVYNSSDVGACELYLLNINQPEPTKISYGSGEKRFPYWEPK